jgi:Uma2 family endonuclease
MSVKSRTGVWRRRWTVEEFYRLLDLGFFDEQRVQLIEGVILQAGPQLNLHAVATALTADALRSAFGPAYWVRLQASLDLTPYSVPDPDLAVVTGAPRTHNVNQNPTSALLIVEVSLTTLAFDRRRKGSLYARAGIEDYWIVNLVDRHLEVYRNPAPDSSQRYGFGYADLNVLTPTDHATPLAAPQARIAVADLLP